jgi:predicted amidohydrolase YtcJ
MTSFRHGFWTLFVFLWSLATPLWAQDPVPPRSADIILHHGKVLTVDKNFSIAEAVAVTGKQITAVGLDQDILKLAGPNTLSIDLKGRTLTPGFVDTHRHIDREAEGAYGGVAGSGGKVDVSTAIKLQRFPIDWRAVKSKDDVLAQMKAWMDRVQFKPAEWVYFVSEGLSIMEANEQARILYQDLNRWEMDKATPNNPIILTMGIPENNGLMVNSKAIDYMFGKWGDFLKKNGHYWIDNAGRPDGHLESPATRFPQNFMYTRPADALAPLFRKTQEELVSMGITTTGSNMPEDSIAAYQLLDARGEQIVRVGYGDGHPFGNITDLKNGLEGLKGKVGSGTEMVWVNSITPGSMDGATTRNCTNLQRMGKMTMLDDYWPRGQCYLDNEYRGASGKGAPISENYYKAWVLATGKYGIRFANTHVAGDRSISLMLTLIEQLQKQYGRAATAGWALDHCTMVNPADFKRAAQLGVMFSCATKYLENGSSYVRTYGGKVAHTFVSIERGKWADLIVLDKDYLTIPVEEVETIQPQLTMVGGKIVFLSPNFADEAKVKPAGVVISTYKELRKRRPFQGALGQF